MKHKQLVVIAWLFAYPLIIQPYNQPNIAFLDINVDDEINVVNFDNVD